MLRFAQHDSPVLAQLPDTISDTISFYYWLLLAESHLTRRLFGAMLRRIELLPLPAG